MGTFKKGILGGFSGKVGTVIGANWRGLDVMRSLPKKSGVSPTLLQVEQRQRFAAVMGFLAPVGNLLASYYGSPSGTLSRLNKAVSYHLKHALMGNSPNFSIDYTKVVLSKGELIGARNAAVSAPTAGSIQLDWDDNSGQVFAAADDLLLAVLYNANKRQFVVEEGPATRQEGTAHMAIPVEFAGDTLQVWIGFVGSTSAKAATSVYLGTVQAV